MDVKDKPEKKGNTKPLLSLHVGVKKRDSSDYLRSFNPILRRWWFFFYTFKCTKLFSKFDINWKCVLQCYTCVYYSYCCGVAPESCHLVRGHLWPRLGSIPFQLINSNYNLPHSFFMGKIGMIISAYFLNWLKWNGIDSNPAYLTARKLHQAIE